MTGNWRLEFFFEDQTRICWHVCFIYILYIVFFYLLTVMLMVILIHDIYIYLFIYWLCGISVREQWLNSAYYIMFLGIQYILITIYYNIYIYMYMDEL